MCRNAVDAIPTVCMFAQHCYDCANAIGGAAVENAYQLPAALLLLRLLAGCPDARIQVPNPAEDWSYARWR
jgi:hypothetical protein